MSHEKLIRVWHGCRVIAVLAVRADGGSSLVTVTGGAGNSSNPSIELDPWAGLIVDHETGNSPLAWREPDE